MVTFSRFAPSAKSRNRHFPLRSLIGFAFIVGVTTGIQARKGLFRSTDRCLSFRKVTGGLDVQILSFGKAPPGSSTPTLYTIGTKGNSRASDDPTMAAGYGSNPMTTGTETANVFARPAIYNTMAAFMWPLTDGYHLWRAQNRQR